MCSSAENNFAEIAMLEVKEQIPLFSKLIDELVATGQELYLRQFFRRLLTEEVSTQVTKTVLSYLAKAIRQLADDSFCDFACFMLTSLKQQSSQSFEDADFVLRDGLFDYYISCSEYTDAAKILAGTIADRLTPCRID